MDRQTLAVSGLAVLFMLVTGYVDMHASETLATLFCLLAFGLICGLLQPKGAWRWGLLIGSSVMLAAFYARATNFTVVDAPADPITLIVLVIPALAAAYLGAGLRYALAALRPPTPA